MELIGCLVLYSPHGPVTVLVCQVGHAPVIDAGLAFISPVIGRLQARRLFWRFPMDSGYVTGDVTNIWLV